MKTKENKIIARIFQLTSIIQMRFPDLYLNLLETPLYMPLNGEVITINDYKQYQDSLEVQIMEMFRKDNHG